MERQSALGLGGQMQQQPAENSHRSVNDFKVIKIVGKGSFGTVRQCQSLIDQNIYAVKSIKLEGGKGEEKM